MELIRLCDVRTSRSTFVEAGELDRDHIAPLNESRELEIESECLHTGPSLQSAEKLPAHGINVWYFLLSLLLCVTGSGSFLMARAGFGRTHHASHDDRKEKSAIVSHHGIKKEPLPEQPLDTSARLFRPDDYIEQLDASFYPGGNLSLYVIGSSNVLWMTWIEQLHLYLVRLGYRLPVVPARTSPQFQSDMAQVCDNSEYFMHLRTARFGKIGWHSWDFAYNDWNDCGADGFRVVADQKVKCEHGPGCSFGKAIIPASDIAKDASRSDVTLLTGWFNDFEPEASKCFNGTTMSIIQLAKISVVGLLRTIRFIHAFNPSVVVLVMGKYDIFRHNYDPKVGQLNQLVKAQVEKQPNTYFVDYRSPPSGGWRFLELVQGKSAPHMNHLNCRGSKLLAFTVLERLYSLHVLARNVKLVDPGVNSNNRRCTTLSGALCRTSVLCWVDPRDQSCKPYGSGRTRISPI